MVDFQKVTLTGEEVAALKAAVESGEYATTSEIVRESLRYWQFKRELSQKNIENIREAIELYVEDCRDAGDPVPTEAGKEFVEIEAA
jgi:Arc/MetJ-type ribon-helix-helix transcriptional regulator